MKKRKPTDKARRIARAAAELRSKLNTAPAHLLRAELEAAVDNAKNPKAVREAERDLRDFGASMAGFNDEWIVRLGHELRHARKRNDVEAMMRLAAGAESIIERYYEDQIGSVDELLYRRLAARVTHDAPPGVVLKEMIVHGACEVFLLGYHLGRAMTEVIKSPDTLDADAQHEGTDARRRTLRENAIAKIKWQMGLARPIWDDVYAKLKQVGRADTDTVIELEEKHNLVISEVTIRRFRHPDVDWDALRYFDKFGPDQS